MKVINESCRAPDPQTLRRRAGGVWLKPCCSAALGSVGPSSQHLPSQPVDPLSS